MIEQWDINMTGNEFSVETESIQLTTAMPSTTTTTTTATTTRTMATTTTTTTTTRMPMETTPLIPLQESKKMKMT